jgi:hypothetical protein
MGASQAAALHPGVPVGFPSVGPAWHRPHWRLLMLGGGLLAMAALISIIKFYGLQRSHW